MLTNMIYLNVKGNVWGQKVPNGLKKYSGGHYFPINECWDS